MQKIIHILTAGILALISSFGAATETKDAQLYLVFPSKTCPSTVCTNRPVLASSMEVQQETLRLVSSDGGEKTVSFAEMRFLPERDGDPLAGLQQTLDVMGYTDGNWEARKKGDDLYEITLTLKDRHHVRADVFRYEVKNNHLVSSKRMTVSAYDGLATAVIVGLLSILVGVGFLYFRKKSRMKSGEPRSD